MAKPARSTTTVPLVAEHWHGKLQRPNGYKPGEYSVVLVGPPNLVILLGRIDPDRMLAHAFLIGEEAGGWAQGIPNDLVQAWNNGVKACRWWLAEDTPSELRPQYRQKMEDAYYTAMSAMLGVTPKELWK